MAGTHDAAGPAAAPVLQVVAGILERADGRVLITQRPEGKVYAGYWEFPGGKVEAGESAFEAIARELREELSIEVEVAHPWLRRRFVYPHATVELRFLRIPKWRGEVRGNEGQAFSWESAEAPAVAPMLPANGPILAALRLPFEYALTQAMDAGIDAQLAALDVALAKGLRLLQVREPGMARDTLAAFAREAIARAHRAGARVLVNGDIELAQALGADGVHLRAAQFATLATRPALPLVGASCHDATELARAEALGCDFAVLGPVAATLTHPGAPPLGWPAFAALVSASTMPVYALGGMTPQDLEAARRHGAQGVAFQRGAWTLQGRADPVRPAAAPGLSSPLS
jgi:8-oxo-dGTP diphosphatase